MKKKLLLFFLSVLTYSQYASENVINQKIHDNLQKKIRDSLELNISDESRLLYQNDLKQYASAIEDAVYASEEEISKELESISPWNEKLVTNRGGTHVLVVSWMSKYAYDNYYAMNHDTEKEKGVTENTKIHTLGESYQFLSWVTVPEESQTFINNFLQKHKRSDLQRRLIQKFGLPPEIPTQEAEKVFVEFWVKPEDLIRPCMNSNVLTVSCAPDYFPKNIEAPFDNLLAIAGMNNEEFTKWYTDERHTKYTKDFMPWTRLGYTFDWGTDFEENPENVPEKGFTEFIIKPGSEIIIERAVPTTKYGSPLSF